MNKSLLPSHFLRYIIVLWNSDGQRHDTPLMFIIAVSLKQKGNKSLNADVPSSRRLLISLKRHTLMNRLGQRQNPLVQYLHRALYVRESTDILNQYLYELLYFCFLKNFVTPSILSFPFYFFKKRQKEETQTDFC